MKIGPVMFFSLFGVELLVQLGLMRRLEPLGRPLARLARLPAESALTFLASIGSLVAGNTMAAQFHQDRKITDAELVASAVFNTVPLHFKESVTFILPVVLPLLGLRLSIIYVSAFLLAGLMKLAFVLIYGRIKFHVRDDAHRKLHLLECELDQSCADRPWKEILGEAFKAKKRLFRRMIVVLSAVTFAVQFLVNAEVMQAFHALVTPLTRAFGLPPSVIGPLGAYVLSPTVGLTFMSNLLTDGLVTEYQAILALLAAGLIMIPVMRLRGTWPRYTAIFGFRWGSIICGLTMGISWLSRALVLVLVWLLWR